MAEKTIDPALAAQQAAAFQTRQESAWQQLKQLAQAPDTPEKANEIFNLMANHPFALNETPTIPVGKDGAAKTNVNRAEFLALQAARLIPLRKKEGWYLDWKNCLSGVSSSVTRSVVATIARQALNFVKSDKIPDLDIQINTTNVTEDYTADEQKAGKRGKKTVSKPVMGSAKVEIANAAMIYTQGNPEGGREIGAQALEFIKSKGGDRAKAITGFWTSAVNTAGASTGSPGR